MTASVLRTPATSAPAVATRFPKRQKAFSAALRAEVDAYFETRGLSRYADWAMVLKGVLLLGLTFGAYAWLLSGTLPAWGMLVACMLIGLGIAGLGFAVGHDAIHGAYSANERVNRAVGLVFDLAGASSYLWRLTHNKIHHTWTNVPGVDEDIVVSPLLRISPASPRRWWHRAQHVYAWLLYSFITLNWVYAKDFAFLRAKKLGPFRDLKHTKGQIAGVVAGKLVYHTWTLVIPLLVLDVTWWQFLIGYLLVHMTAGFVLSVVFQLAHIVEDAQYPTADADGTLPFDWHVHQLQTTVDFAPNNRLLTWYCGGLNHQVEHHLFPRICSRHYTGLRPIVERVAAQHNVPYHVAPTVRSALASHYRMLKRFGRADKAAPRPA